MNLTEKWIEKQKPGKVRQQFRDDLQPGFGLRFEPNGRRSFYYYAKVAGQPTYRSLGEFPFVTVKDARAEAAKLAGLAAKWKQAGYPADSNPFQKAVAPKPPATAPTFGELVESYIEHHVRQTASKPDRAEYDVNLLLKTHFKEWKDRPLDSLRIEDLLAVRTACGTHRVAANRCVQFGRRLFKWSAGDGETGQANFWPIENFAKRVRTFKEEPRERFLQPDELVRFNDELEQETHADLKDFLVLSLATGARRSAVFSMRWQDVGFERANWHVPFTASKNGESYEVNLSPAALATLERRKRERVEGEEFVFPGIGGSKHLIDLKKPWDEFRKRAGIPDIRVHDLRRSHGSYMAISGANLPTIGAALGHRSTASTAIYARLIQDTVKKARQASERKMRQLMEQARRNGSAQQKPAVRPKSPKLLKSAS